ncbi:hypothetical protein KIL84_002893 [Mauremys mutica]|uniref:Uncharacterized protein n=1 Tax=Mauremys mutica TaxID=74926 RepID=A0A9D3WV52_9SAUR|nr:hypothetical protein KIL84_002893 [Mauremys mutica]
MALRNRILAQWIWMMQAFQSVTCNNGSVWRMIHLFGPLISLVRLVAKEDFKKKEQREWNTDFTYVCVYTEVCVYTGTCIYNYIYLNNYILPSNYGQKWPFCFFSSLIINHFYNRKGPNYMIQICTAASK